MVKVQKPNPKAFKNLSNGNKSNVMKKKPAKDVEAIPSSNVTAKKAKTKLVEKAVQENEIKTVEKVNKPPTWKQNANKKRGGLAQNVETKPTAKKLVRDFQKHPNRVWKKNAAAEDNVQKIKYSAFKKPQRKNVPFQNKHHYKKGSAEDKPQKKNVPFQNKPHYKKGSAEDKPQKKNVPFQNKPHYKKGSAEDKPQKKNVPFQNKPHYKKGSAEDKPQKRKATAEDKSQVNVSKKQKQEAPTPSKKAKKTPVLKFESKPFEEDDFNKVVNSENIKKIGQALKSLAEKQVNEKKTYDFSKFRYFLNVCSYKIADCPKSIVKLNLQHSLVDPTVNNVVLIVPDLQRGADVDYKPTIQHYEDLYRKAGVTGLKIVPLNQLRTEYTTCVAKRKFANSYEYFLCDSHVINHVIAFCGAFFQKSRTTFHAVRLNDPTTYKQDIELALKRSSYKQLRKGDLISIPVGNHHYSVDELADNILMVIQQLKTVYPGGLANIRSMHLKIDIKGTSALPLYVNLAGAPAEVPNVFKKETNEVLSQSSLSKTGDLVKLDKTQVERKRQIQEARKALLSEPAVVAEETDAVPAKKSKKAKKEVEPKVEEVEEDDDDDEDEDGDDDNEDDDDEDGDDDDEEGDDDDEEEDDDDEEGDDDDEEGNDDDEEGDDDDEEGDDDVEEGDDDEDDDE